ncbi:MAG: cytochrome-c oxidase, cbb3-type subunit III [Gammaproteobacteria bacterium]|nr:cytochrome-c oxidase, cbb3-type subunit III [Gammaproteobacteria bacterium]
MSDFWSGWIAVTALGNIAFVLWLIRYTSKMRNDVDTDEVMDHSWDGLQEFNNPLPRWWLMLLYISIGFALLYMLLFPSFGKWGNLLGWSQNSAHYESVVAANSKYAPIFEVYADVEVEALHKDPKAMEIARRMFLNNCATCHGSDARGSSGFPNLTDDDWLYGGDAVAIKATLTNGRQAVMPSFAGLGEEAIDNIAEYVMSLGGRAQDEVKAEAGKAQFGVCMGCHGADAKGNQALGAPNLTDDIWLYGGSRGAIVKTLLNGRNGVMPNFSETLSEEKIHLLTAYAYGLSRE